MHAPQLVGVVRAELGPHKRQRVLVKLEGVSAPAEDRVTVGQIVHALERVRVLCAERCFPKCERLFTELQSFAVAPEVVVAVGQQLHALERVQVVQAAMLGVDGASHLELF